MTTGTLTIKCQIPLDYDGLSLGYSETKTIRFLSTTEGFTRHGKLYKTLDPAYLCDQLQECADWIVYDWKLTINGG